MNTSISRGASGFTSMRAWLPSCFIHSGRCTNNSGRAVATTTMGASPSSADRHCSTSNDASSARWTSSITKTSGCLRASSSRKRPRTARAMSSCRSGRMARDWANGLSAISNPRNWPSRPATSDTRRSPKTVCSSARNALWAVVSSMSVVIPSRLRNNAASIVNGAAWPSVGTLPPARKTRNSEALSTFLTHSWTSLVFPIPLSPMTVTNCGASKRIARPRAASSARRSCSRPTKLRTRKSPFFPSCSRSITP